jgi:hypothetical protein
MRLRRITGFLLGCWAVAGVSAGAAYGLATSANARLAGLVRQCEETKLPIPAVCKPHELRKLTKYPGEIIIRHKQTAELYFGSPGTPFDKQKWDLVAAGPTAPAILDAEEAANRWGQWAPVVFLGAAALVVLGFLPWGWYFLLARVRELAAAIRGER